MELWVGLAELRANPKCKNFRRFGKGKGAFVWIAAWAESSAAFETKVKISSENLDCILYGIEEVERFDDRIEREGDTELFTEMRATATRQPQDTVFGTFQIWLEDDRN